MEITFMLVATVFFFIIYAGYIFWLRRGLSRLDSPSKSEFETSLKFSVIIAAHNEAAVIEKTLQKLSEQNYPADNYEIIVAADRCSDDTEIIISKYSESRLNIKLLPVKDVPRGFAPKKFALSKAIEQARYEILILMDADCSATPSYLSTFNAYFQNGAEVVLNVPKVRFKKNLLHRYLLPERIATWLTAAAGVGNGSAFLAFGGSWAYKKSLMENIGGFNSIKHSLSGDDDLLVAKFAKINAKIKFNLNPDGWVVTDLPETFWHFIRQRRRHHSAGTNYAPGVQVAYAGFHLSNYWLWISTIFYLPALIFLAAKILLDIFLLNKAANMFCEKLSPMHYLVFEIGFFLHNFILAPSSWLGKVRWK